MECTLLRRLKNIGLSTNGWSVFLYSLIFGFWILKTPSLLLGTLLIFMNFLLARGLMSFSGRIVNKIHRPNYFYRSEMRIVDVIKRETTSWGKDSQIYDNKDDYEKRKEFEVGQRAIWVSYLLTLIVLSSFNYAILLVNGNNNYFVINWRVALAVFFFSCAYIVLTIFVEGWEFEKTRFGNVDVKRILIDYVPLLFLFIALALWLVFDVNSLEKLYILLSTILGLRSRYRF